MEDDKIRDSMNEPTKNQDETQAAASAEPTADPAVQPQTAPQGDPQTEPPESEPPESEPRESEHRDEREGEQGSGHSGHHGSHHHSSRGSSHSSRHSSHSGSSHSSRHSSHSGSSRGSHHSSHSSSRKTKKKENYKKKQLRKVDKKSIFWLSCLLFLILAFSLVSYLYNSTDLFNFMKKTGSGDPAVTETEAPTSEETSETPEESIPEGVKQAAAEVVGKANAHAEEHAGHRIIRFMISADAHQDNDNDVITKGTRELGWAQAEILGQLDVDFIASLGDYAWASNTNTVAEVADQIRTYNALVSSKYRDDVCQLWLEGNHDDGVYSLEKFPDTPRMNATVLHNLIYSQNSDVVYDAAHSKDGYFYKDFEHLKVRVICLNTEQGDGDGAMMEDYQLRWFAETALDMSGKSDWSVMTLAHHPLDWGFSSLVIGCVDALDAFMNGSTFEYATENGTKISVDYADKSCRYIAHFHGHTHAYTVLPIRKWAEDEKSNTNAYEIGIPNACFYRNNQNFGNTNPDIARFATTYTHHKLDEDGKRTSFSVVTICLEDGIIYVDNYGVGVDREVNY